MGFVFDEIDDAMVGWLMKQAMFFVATAPSGDSGRVNVSPKGDMRSFAVLGPHQVAYLDLAGSGIETVAHVRENGRITVMLCAFSGRARIVRLHGRGQVVQVGDDDFMEYFVKFTVGEKVVPAMRSIVVIDVDRISDSCGYGVPRMDVKRERFQSLYDYADDWVEDNGAEGKDCYRRIGGMESIDGLPGLK